jgi:hypothetical protein
MTAREQIERMVHRETEAWDTQNAELLVSVFHPDMVWPWPPHAQAHDPADWLLVWGRYDRERWRAGWQELFDTHELVHNRRSIVRVEVSQEQDGAFAVVDVDTLWRNRETGADSHWCGRACKVYSLVSGEWKMMMHTGLLDYDTAEA